MPGAVQHEHQRSREESQHTHTPPEHPVLQGMDQVKDIVMIIEVPVIHGNRIHDRDIHPEFFHDIVLRFPVFRFRRNRDVAVEFQVVPPAVFLIKPVGLLNFVLIAGPADLVIGPDPLICAGSAGDFPLNRNPGILHIRPVYFRHVFRRIDKCLEGAVSEIIRAGPDIIRFIICTGVEPAPIGKPYQPGPAGRDDCPGDAEDQDTQDLRPQFFSQCSLVIHVKPPFYSPGPRQP